ncbi:sterol reductase [Moesziomyces antarcticus T-34]|uniref:Sterol reductase n=1 Tax=Pseudozyma antarctica (strain T-34) TaxID=1151754 RepID=M9LS92_PSEA3|nr:sterol reductase [Moesziomyces antarcticus T-34]
MADSAGLRTRSAAAKASATPNGKSKSTPKKRTVVQDDSDEDKANYTPKHSYLHVDLNDDQIMGGGKQQTLVKYTPGIVISEQGRETDKKLDEHSDWEFGGPWGVTAMMTLFPLLMYYLWICLWFYDGKLVVPNSLDDIWPFLQRMGAHVRDDAFPTKRAFAGYGGLMVFQFLLAVVMPGYMQEGLPVPSLGYKTLMYKCNALSSFYATLVTCAVLHVSGVYRLTTIIEHFGEYMTVSMVAGYAVSAATYFHAVATNTTHRMSGNFAYDFFMGAALNPRIGSVDLKMWAEVRIPCTAT